MSVSVDIPVKGSKTPKRVRVTPEQSRYLEKVQKGRTCHRVILSVSQSKSGTLNLRTIPGWILDDPRDTFRLSKSELKEFKGLLLELDPDGSWFYEGLKNRPGTGGRHLDYVQTRKNPKEKSPRKNPKTPSSDPSS